jgi:hypothetical protein
MDRNAAKVLLCDNHAHDQVVYVSSPRQGGGSFGQSLHHVSGARRLLVGAATAPLFWSVMFVPTSMTYGRSA